MDRQMAETVNLSKLFRIRIKQDETAAAALVVVVVVVVLVVVVVMVIVAAVAASAAAAMAKVPNSHEKIEIMRIRIKRLVICILD